MSNGSMTKLQRTSYYWLINYGCHPAHVYPAGVQASSHNERALSVVTKHGSVRIGYFKRIKLHRRLRSS